MEEVRELKNSRRTETNRDDCKIRDGLQGVKLELVSILRDSGGSG